MTDQENYSFNYYYGQYRDVHQGTSDTPSAHFTTEGNSLYSSASANFSGQNYLYRDIGNLSGKSKISFTAWYKSENTEEEILFTDSENDSGTFKLFSNNSGSRPDISIYDGFTGFYSVTGTRSINDGQWHHLAATVNTQATFPTEPHLKLYIDGELDSSGSAGPVPGAVAGVGRFAPQSVLDTLEETLITDTGEDISTRFDNYVNMGGGTNNSYLYFARPITNGIDKWRLRYENGGAAHNKVQIYLLLRHKETGATSSSRIQRWQGGFTNRNYYVDHCRGHSYAHLPFPNAIMESGITYKRSNGAGHQIFPATSSHMGVNCRSNYPLRVSDNRYYEKGFIQDPPYAGKLMGNGGNDHRFWPPRLYGNDWDELTYTDYEIYGLFIDQDLGGVTSRLYEFGLYLSGERYDLFKVNPFNNYTELSNQSHEDITLGSSAGYSRSDKISGQIDHFSFYDNELTSGEIRDLYLSGSYDHERANELKTSGWYEFSNPNNIGLDSHYLNSDQDVVRLYHFNNDTENESNYNATLNLVGSPIFESGDNTKFGTSNLYLSGENQRAFDLGGHELTLNQDFTIEFFIKFKSKPEQLEAHRILETKNYKGTSVNYNFSATSNKFILDVKEGNNDFKTFESVSTNIENDIWYHIVLGRKDNEIIMLQNGSIICKESMPFYLPLDDAEHGFSIGGGVIANIEEFRITKDNFIYDLSNLIIPPTQQLSKTIKKRNNLSTNLPIPTIDTIKERRVDALYLNRSQYLTATNDHSAFCFGDENFSFTTWVKPTVIEDLTVLGVWNDSGIRSYALMAFAADKTFRFLASADGTSYGNVTSLSSTQEILFKDKWYFICGIHDADSDELKLYIYDEKDQISLTSKPWAEGIMKDQHNNEFQFNGSKNGMSCATDIHVDQLAFFNKALSVNEVSEVWNGGMGQEYQNIENTTWKSNIISWFDFYLGSTHDTKNSNHLTASSSLTISNGRRSTGFEDAKDGSEILFFGSREGSQSLFSPEGRETIFKESVINNHPAILFKEDNNSGDFLDSTYTLPLEFTIFAALSGSNEEYAPIINNTVAENQGFSIYNSGDSFKIQINNESAEVNCPAKYHTIAATYKNGTGKLFVNGEDGVVVEDELSLNAKPISIGKLSHVENDQTNSYFNGLISEIIIFDHSEPLDVGTKNYLAQKYRLNKLKIS